MFHSNMALQQNGPYSGAIVYHGNGACEDIANGTAGHFRLSAPHPDSDHPIPVTASSSSPLGGGQRYQEFLGVGGSFYFLLDSAEHCKRYTLEFDLYRKPDGSGSPLSINIGFADSAVNLGELFGTPPENLFNFLFNNSIAFTVADVWTHVSIPFAYCGQNPSNLMYLGCTSPYTAFIIDNLQLKEDTSAPPPLIATLSDSVIVASCETEITTSVENAFCDLSYSWSTPAGTILSYNTDSSSVRVPFDIPATYSVTVSDGCRSTGDTITVDTTTFVITGTDLICEGSSTGFSVASPGGIWSSSDTIVAKVNAATGLVTGISNGTAVISYAYCSRLTTITVTVIGPVAIISGSGTVCAGSHITLSHAVSGGTWISQDTSLAVVDATGNVTGVAMGTVVITYMLTPGCYTTKEITVNPVPLLFGPDSVCIGSTIVVAANVLYGTWSSSNTAIATVVFTTLSYGNASGIAAGTCLLTYTAPTGCLATTELTVNPVPASITGASEVCIGGSLLLSNATPGGSWSSGATAIATVGTGGTVTGISNGTVAISYTVASTGCSATKSITVNALPDILGSPQICESIPATLTSTSPGGTWSSSDISVADVGATTGIVNGIVPGTAIISYTAPSTGCMNTLAVTVNAPLPAITGTTTMCVGGSVALTNSVSGGTWSSSNILVATVGTGGVVNGVASGTATITYSVASTGCYVTETVTVAPLPSAISGVLSVCEGSSTLLGSTPSGGTWSTASPNINISVSGNVDGLLAGTAVVSYTTPVTGCMQTAVVTVNSVPAPILGAASTCELSATVLSCATPGGTWSSGAPSIATVTGGVVSGTSAGLANISYILTTTGCSSVRQVTVNPLPAAIMGATAICQGTTVTLSSATPGGTWISSNGAIASADAPSGNITGVSVGTAVITYQLTATGCYRTITVSVIPLPAPISGIVPLCPGGSITLTSSGGGLWTSDAPPIATIGATTGIVTGIAAGIAHISFTAASGCTITAPLNVVPPPPPITGVAEICVGNTTLLGHPVPGGTWTSGDVTRVTIDPATGLATGISLGIAPVTYTLTITGCYTVRLMTMNPTPPPVTGADKVCVGNTNYVFETGSVPGIWSSSDISIATVGSLGVITTGAITGVSVGTVRISYTYSTGCTAYKTVTVGPAVTPITGNNALCHGDTMLLSNPTPGGTWSSLDVSRATIHPSLGIVSVSAPGTPAAYLPGDLAHIRYTTEPGCYTEYFFPAYYNNGDNCIPCAQFGTRDFTIISGGAMLAPGLTGNYWLTGDMTVQNDLVLQDAVLFIKPGVKITVDPAYSLTSNGSHLFSCGTGMWKGIEMKTGPTGSGVRTARAILQGSTGNDYGVSTLIEDAETAVSVFNPVKPNIGGNYFIESRNTIFNHNNNGIYIDNYTPSVSSLLATPQMYEFLIKNTTFTCRNIGATTPGFPVSWPSNYGPGGMKAYTSPATPYEPSKYVTNYTYSLCHNGLPAYTGVKLNKVGVTTGGTYTGIQIGAPSSWGFDPLTGYAPEQNMFDALGHGIWAVNTNLKVRNGIFEKMKTTIVSGPWPLGSFIEQTGVYTEMNDTKKYELDIQPVTSGYGIDAQTATNSFYDCAYGVYSKNYNRITCNGTYMWSTQVFGSGSGKQGIVLQSPSYEQVQANDNSIYNLKNGISFVSSYTGGVMVPVGPDLWMWSLAVSHIGNLEINNNRIQAAVGTTTPTTQYVSFAIAVQNSLPTPTGFASTATGEVHTDGNTIKDAFRGILVNGYQLQPAKTKNNTVTVRPAPATPMQKGWGIDHSNNHKGLISGNTVTGVWSGNYDALNDSIRAYLCELNGSETVMCNYADNTGRGYEFFHDNPGTWWLKNEMVKHMKGYMLNYSAIGPQGWSGFNFENTWSNSSWWGIGSSKYQTFVEGSPAAGASQLYVSPSVFQEPTENWGNPTPGAYSSSSIHAATGYQLINCQSDDPISSGGPTARAGAYEPHVKDLVTYDAHADARKWIAQYAAWEAVNIDTVLTDSSAVLAQFKSMAAGSRMAYLSDIEVALATGDLATAGTLIATPPSPLSPALCIDTTTGVNIKDDSTVDYIIDKNRELYDIYLRYMQYTMDSVDTASIPVIAQLCPLRYGSVVYKARALYTAVYNDLQVWCENCEDMESAEQQQGGQKPGIKPAVTGDGMQAYALFPNPNDGNLVLVQKVADTGLVAVDVADVLGRSVYKQQVRFTEKNHHLNLQNIAPGMYVTTVTDANGRKYTFKFVKQ